MNMHLHTCCRNRNGASPLLHPEKASILFQLAKAGKFSERHFSDHNMAAENRMNLCAVQQRDPYITQILDTASQVALYSFNSTKTAWV